MNTAYEKAVIEDHTAHVGVVLLAYWVNGYVGDTDEQRDVRFDPPIRVRVLPMRPNEGLLHYCDEFIDPYWDVEIVETQHPALPAGGLRSCWIFGRSINTKTGEHVPCIEWQREGEISGKAVRA